LSEELDIRSLSDTAAAKLLKVSPKTIREHVRRGLPLVDLPAGQAGKRIDLIVYGAWLNQQEQNLPVRQAGRQSDGA